MLILMDKKIIWPSHYRIKKTYQLICVIHQVMITLFFRPEERMKVSSKNQFDGYENLNHKEELKPQ